MTSSLELEGYWRKAKKSVALSIKTDDPFTLQRQLYMWRWEHPLRRIMYAGLGLKVYKGKVVIWHDKGRSASESNAEPVQQRR